MGVLASAEKSGDANLVAFGQKLFDFINFDIHVVLANFEAKPHLFEIRTFLLFLALLLLFLFLVDVFTPIDNTRDRWVRLGRYFNQVKTC